MKITERLYCIIGILQIALAVIHFIDKDRGTAFVYISLAIVFFLLGTDFTSKERKKQKSKLPQDDGDMLH